MVHFAVVGGSYFEYRGRGFFTADAYVQLLLAFLCEEIDRVPETPDWVRKTRADWHKQATNGTRGLVWPGLDEHLGEDPDRVNVVLTLVDRVRQRLEDYGEAVAKDVVNDFGTGRWGDRPEDRGFGADVPTDVLIGDINSLTAVLRDEHVYGPCAWNVPPSLASGAQQPRTHHWYVAW